MSIKNTGIKVSEDDPFKEDVLQRKESAEILTKLFTTIEEPFVLSVSSPWGTGKTTFVRMWMQHLKNETFHCVYFNAWQNQHGQDPFVSFMAEINKGIVNKLQGKNSKVQKSFEEAKKIGTTVLKKTIPALAKIATHGVIDIDQISEALIADAVGGILDDQIQNYTTNRDNLDKFKDRLEKFVIELNNSTGTKKTIGIFY